MTEWFIADTKVCSVCGSINKVMTFRKSKQLYCSKHYQQLYRYGGILEFSTKDTNEIVENGDYFSVILRNKKREVVGETIIDKYHIELVRSRTWCLNSVGYAVSDNILLHRFILNPNNNEIVDHIDGDKLNNRTSNLRIVTKSQNAMNSKIRANSRTGITGVHFDKRDSVYQAYISVNGKKLNLGRFKNIEDAKSARLSAEIEYFGEYRY